MAVLAMGDVRARGRAPGCLDHPVAVLGIPAAAARAWSPPRTGEGALETIGVVSGLGIDEQIYAVRFVGDAGYVVTFRQTDPLYVIDLSDPAAPQVAGELKIPGYSAISIRSATASWSASVRTPTSTDRSKAPRWQCSMSPIPSIRGKSTS